jgi:hypothetical protein
MRTLVLLLAAAPVFAQLPSSTVTITATRSVAVQPDQALLSLTVTSSLETNLDQIVSPLSGLGITPLNLTGVDNTSVSNFGAPMLQWNFNLAVPLSNLTATIASLTNLVPNIAQNSSGLTLSFDVAGVQTSAQAQASQQAQTCTNANLISDATAQAQKLAAAAGMTLGPILRLATAPSPAIVPAGVAGATYALLVPANVYFAPGVYSEPSTCSLTLQFQLLP